MTVRKNIEIVARTKIAFRPLLLMLDRLYLFNNQSISVKLKLAIAV